MSDAAPNLSISPEKVCFIVAKAREFDVKDVVTDPDDSSNASDDAGPFRSRVRPWWPHIGSTLTINHRRKGQTRSCVCFAEVATLAAWVRTCRPRQHRASSSPVICAWGSGSEGICPPTAVDQSCGSASRAWVSSTRQVFQTVSRLVSVAKR
jgi:hypothetical protein